MNFIKENYKWIGAVAFLLFRILCGIKRRSPGNWEKFVKRLGGFGPIINLILEIEKSQELHGSTKKTIVSGQIQEVYKKITGEELPLDMANLLVELGLQEVKEWILKNRSEKQN